MKVDVAVRGNDPKFKLKIGIHGYVDEITGNLTKDEMISLAERKIRDEVKSTFEKGVQHKTDLYSLRNDFYHKNFKEWKRKKEGQLLQLTPDSLESVEVNVELEHAGMNRLHRSQASN
ncbi:Ger(x)C family spore germination C-terminal domain-containing protein [Paenibacillus guangzhouensis]|uniref:Ger(x)C family spore germination C-terminal domain-containing protein n=1 Tax=Paenibacillus guangzhouensis TaxID=1473112 RepID=UPI0012668F9B|nr:Ger(x)C family spore germination C-terminal domain-containing protein [Paenibacillus guangzhouensis]